MVILLLHTQVCKYFLDKVMYKISFWFEHGGGCLWAKNDEAKEKYGYLISPKNLSLSEKTILEIERLEKLYFTYLNWSNPIAPSKWTTTEKLHFLELANDLYNNIVDELGCDFIIENNVKNSIQV